MPIGQTESARRTDEAATAGPVAGNGLTTRDWQRWMVAVGFTTVFALVAAWLTPRGPVTTTEAVLTIVAGIVVGLGAGIATSSRWSMLVAPVVFITVFELLRLDLVGPTVDAIDLGSFLSIAAFVLGRGLLGLLVLVPLAVGAAYGVVLSDRLRYGESRLGGLGKAILGLSTLALAGLLVLIMIPASTAPIVGGDGSPTASVAELTSVEIGGHDQVLMIRGRNVDNPVLLYLAGGPGGTDIGAIRGDTALEQDFVVVVWEQRGAGKSYAALDPTDTFTLEQLVSDTIEVSNYLRDRFDEDRLYLVGNSWGTTLGVLAAQQSPELYHAFVGAGQMVSQRETDIMFWEDALAWAERTGNAPMAEELRANGPPPYENVYDYDPVVSTEHSWNAYPEFDSSNEMPAILFVPEYSFMDRVNAFKGFLDTNATLYPQLQSIDFREDVPELGIPFVMVTGEHEARGRATLANEWFEILEAPDKASHVFEGAGHRPHFDQPARFAEVMRDVLAATYRD